MTNYRNVAALIFAVMLLQGGAGVLGVAVPLGLDHMGESALGVGVTAAIFSAGFMLGAWRAPAIVRAVGHIRGYSASAAIYTAGILGLALAPWPVAWGGFRFAQGAASAVMFAAAESWITDATPVAKRGAVMGLYQVLIKISLALGPLAVLGRAPGDVQAFVWAAFFMALSLVPMCATRRDQPPAPYRGSFSPLELVRLAPAAAAGAFVAGLANQGVIGLLPLYAKHVAPKDAQSAAVALSMAAWIGGTAAQWPAGLISDRVDRRQVVAVLGLAAMAVSAALWLLGGDLPWLATVGLTFAWGAGSLSFYAVSAAHAVDRADAGTTAQAMSGMLFVWAVGAVAGPVIAGAVSDTPLGPSGVFAFAAVSYALLVAANLGRAIVRPPGRRRARFAPVAANSQSSGAGLEAVPATPAAELPASVRASAKGAGV